MADTSSSVRPNPFVCQPEERIRQLKEVLQTELGQLQKANIETLIKMYETGELGPLCLKNPPVYLAGGKHIDHDPWKDPSLTPGPVKWCEVSSFSPFETLITLYNNCYLTCF